MLWCKHDWDKISEAILPSAYEQIAKGGQQHLKMKTAECLFTKKFILVMVCRLCGKVKTITEENPPC